MKKLYRIDSETESLMLTLYENGEHSHLAVTIKDRSTGSMYSPMTLTIKRDEIQELIAALTEIQAEIS